MSFVEIAEATGYHRTTIANWIKAGGPPAKRAPAAARVVLTDRWQRRIAELLEGQPTLLSTSIHELLVAEGFDGSYATVVREASSHPWSAVQSGKGGVGADRDRPRRRAQFDFADVMAAAARWGWIGPLWCFGMILCWSRWRRW